MSNYLNETRADVPTRSDDPEVIRRDIEATRQGLSRDVDALTEKVSPGRVMHRSMDRAKGRFASAKDRVMGSSPGSHRSSGGGAVGAVGGKASSMASAVGDAASSAPQLARQQTEGNPLAAGLIAFGVGWLASSLLPATEKEREAASSVKDMAQQHSDALTAPVKDAAQSMKAPAQEAVQAVKGRATDAAATVKDEASSAKDDVAGSAQHARDEVRSTT